MRVTLTLQLCVITSSEFCVLWPRCHVAMKCCPIMVCVGAGGGGGGGPFAASITKWWKLGLIQLYNIRY